MKVLDLFCGTGSIAKVAEARGHEVVTLDFDPQFGADIVCDILKIPDDNFAGEGFDMIWASPPCTTFSVASMGKHWTGGRRAYIPKTREAEIGLAILRKTEAIITYTSPAVWCMENPRGMMRKMTAFPRSNLRTVTYCKYGDTRMKPTDIWSNLGAWWTPKPPCKNGEPCHVAAPGGVKQGRRA